MQGAIDSHVHVWTDDRRHYPRVAASPDYPPDRFTPEDFLAHARPCGVSRAVLVQMSFYGFDNRYMLDSMRAHPGVFSGIGIVDAEAGHPQDAMRRLAAEGVRGFRISRGGQPESWLERPGMQAMWRFAGEQGFAMCPLINPPDIDRIGAMCSRSPDTTVVIDHLARIGMDGVIRDADVRRLSGLARHRRVFLKVSAFYALGRKRPPYDDLAPMVQQLFESYGPQRLMWGSDSPFQVQNGNMYAASIAFVRERLPFLSEEDRSWLLSRTAASVFFRA